MINIVLIKFTISHYSNICFDNYIIYISACISNSFNIRYLRLDIFVKMLV